MSNPDDTLSAWQRAVQGAIAFFKERGLDMSATNEPNQHRAIPTPGAPLHPQLTKDYTPAIHAAVLAAQASNPTTPTQLPVIPKAWVQSNKTITVPNPLPVSFDNLPPADTVLANGGTPLPTGPVTLSWNPNANVWEGRPVGTAGAWETDPGYDGGHVFTYHGFGTAAMLVFVG